MPIRPTPKPPITTPQMTGMTRTSADVATLMWDRKGNIADETAKNRTTVSAKPIICSRHLRALSTRASYFDSLPIDVVRLIRLWQVRCITETAVTDDDSSIVEPAGKFRIYLGAAAGVGKTVAMLDEGLRRFHRGTDVVVGLVDTHDRLFTENKVEGLEIIPRKNVTYKGKQFTELDLEAVLQRRPEVVLVDELALGGVS